MNWLNKLERKFGRYAVPNLIVYLIGAYSVGFVLNMVAPNILGFLNFQPYYILHGQIWRLIFLQRQKGQIRKIQRDPQTYRTLFLSA